MKKIQFKRDFDYWIDECMYNCRSRKLRPKYICSLQERGKYTFYATEDCAITYNPASAYSSKFHRNILNLLQPMI